MPAIFDLRCVGLHNVPMKEGESQAAYLDRIVLILTDLGFKHEADNIGGITVSSSITTCITFKDQRAAEAVIKGSERFHLDYWKEKPDSASIIKGIITLKDICKKATKKEGLENFLHFNGYIHVTRWRRSQPKAQGAASAAASAPKRASSSTWG